MKHLFVMVVICALLMVTGCSGNNVGISPSFPETTLGASGSGAGPRITTEAMQSDSSASGGSSLPAAAPYANDSKGPAVQQNVNAMPFMTSSSPMKSGMSLPESASALVSRADGTMYGPKDMSPAGIGPGMEGPGRGEQRRIRVSGALEPNPPRVPQFREIRATKAQSRNNDLAGLYHRIQKVWLPRKSARDFKN